MRSTIKRWETGGFSGLFESLGRGAKPRLTTEDMTCVERWINDDPREWHQFNAQGIAGRMFETVYDLGIVVEASVEERYGAKNYNVERFIFKSS